MRGVGAPVVVSIDEISRAVNSSEMEFFGQGVLQHLREIDVVLSGDVVHPRGNGQGLFHGAVRGTLAVFEGIGEDQGREGVIVVNRRVDGLHRRGFGEGLFVVLVFAQHQG